MLVAPNSIIQVRDCSAFAVPPYPHSSPLLLSYSEDVMQTRRRLRRTSYSASQLNQSSSQQPSLQSPDDYGYANDLITFMTETTIHHRCYERAIARDMVNQILCPPAEERERDIAGTEAYDDDNNDCRVSTRLMTNDDPRGEYTYGEFPFSSFDQLIDRGLDFVAAPNDGDRRRRRKHTMVDLGSGCGRLVLYAALTRGGSSTDDAETTQWDVHGIEIGMKLHSLAVRSLQRGIDHGMFSRDNSDVTRYNGGRIIGFHNGNVLHQDSIGSPSSSTSSSPTFSSSSINSIRLQLSQTNLLFAYSTVWETSRFDPELGAMILSSKWSNKLASACSDGCVAITTDRALDPNDGWKLVDRLEVENPCVWGSVGYISVLEKKMTHHPKMSKFYSI